MIPLVLLITRECNAIKMRINIKKPVEPNGLIVWFRTPLRCSISPHSCLLFPGSSDQRKGKANML